MRTRLNLNLPRHSRAMKHLGERRIKIASNIKPRLPNGVRIYAISDIHGRADLLRDVFAAIDLHLRRAGPARALHVFLGDYIDRGPNSSETLDLLIDRSQRHEAIFLK